LVCCEQNMHLGCGHLLLVLEQFDREENGYLEHGLGLGLGLGL
jgi:hypothetical protein